MTTKTKENTDTTLILGEIAPYKTKKKDEYMDSKQQEHFLKILEIWRKQILEKNNDTLIHMHDIVIT